MLVLLLVIAFGIVFAFFSSQNTQVVTLRLNEYVISNIPVYLIATGSLLLGIFVAWIISLADSFSNLLAMFSKDFKIKRSEKNIEQMSQRIRQLEEENARIRHERPRTLPMTYQSAFAKPNFFQKLRQRLSF
jgi:hypothetical protein